MASKQEKLHPKRKTASQGEKVLKGKGRGNCVTIAFKSLIWLESRGGDMR